MSARRRVLASGFALVAVLAACSGPRVPTRPDDACTSACVQRISRCSASACARGCQIALDRIVEQEGEAVLACVGRSRDACGDWVWADCAARLGPHADGGPPPPVAGPRR